ncbi:DUF4129 domain-containing protein [Zhihengliuella sp. ISTPL4]|uniref:DUF4129 domain-containing protein n=1 Tax=Zhihengliuella sp. ISTPL4 TaxID=2058657 RepID=UPI000C7CBDFC|nr:DUF4129 domain-containing protein [Zhihengliuella sp. ISTPL4]
MSRPEPPVLAPERVRRPGPPLLLGLAAVAGLFGLLMFAAALQGTPQFPSTDAASPSPPPDNVVLPAPAATETPLPPESWGDSVLAQVLGVVFGLVLGLVVLALVLVVVRQLIRFLMRLWRDRPLARRDGAATGPDAGPTPPEILPDEVIIRHGVSDALRTVIERPEPGDAIIAAWIGLEESAADAGQGRAPTETPAEFTARVIGARRGIAADVVVLQSLYERVRFGGLIAAEGDRRSAADALRGIKAGWR